jgi:endonuclease/exonuclease/phosphatase family metal-dependent hydrolase
MWRIILSLLVALQLAGAETVSIATWNLEWFPGKKPTSTQAERSIHMSSAKDALMEFAPDILCAQEIRDWDSFVELTSILPKLTPLIVSRFRDSPTGGPISIQQTAIASIYPADSAWYEAFNRAQSTPPRGFSFAAIPLGKTMLLLYSVHLKSNMGGVALAAPKREEAAKQLMAHVGSMEKPYGKRGPVAVIIAGDFNTDPTDPQFAGDNTFDVFTQAGFQWAWQNTPRDKRVTHPGRGRYPDATFDSFLTKGVKVLSSDVLAGTSASDHSPVVLKISLP